jgi:hypothetical protein
MFRPALSAVVATALLAPGVRADGTKGGAADLDELKYAVGVAEKRGANVGPVRAALTAFEGALVNGPPAPDAPPPPELAALRAAVEAAVRKGEAVEAIDKELAAVEKALTGRAFERIKGPDPRPKDGEVRRIDWPGIHVYYTAFSPNGRLLLGVGDAGRVRVWDAGAADQLAEFPLLFAAFTPDSRRVIGASDATVSVYDLATGREVRKWDAGKSLASIAVSGTGARVLTGHADNAIRVWDAATGKEVGRFEGHAAPPTAVFSADDKQVVSAAADRTVRLWDVATGKEVRKFAGFETVLPLPGTDLAVHAAFVKGGRVAGWVWGRQKVLIVWDAATGKEVSRTDLGADYHKDLAVSPDGRWFLSCHENHTVRLRDLTTGEVGERFVVPDVMVARSPSFSPDGRCAAAGSHRGRIYIWGLPDLATLTPDDFKARAGDADGPPGPGIAPPGGPFGRPRPGRPWGPGFMPPNGGPIGPRPNPPGVPRPGPPPGGEKGRDPAGNESDTTAITITNDAFTIRARHGDVTVIVTGSLAAPAAPKIVIQKGDQKTETDDLKKVPEEHLPAVERLLKMVRRD